MPEYKLTILISSDKPLYPYERCRIDTSIADAKTFIVRDLMDSLEIGTDFRMVIPLDEHGNDIEDVPLLSRFIKKLKTAKPA